MSSYYDWELQTYNWKDEAACNEADPRLFTTLERGEPEVLGLGAEELRNLNLENFEDAVSYCDRCPVLTTCKSAATQDDLDWTVRGGELPLLFQGKPTVRGKKTVLNANGDWKCGQGHFVDAGDVRCPVCRRASLKAYNLRKREGRITAGQRNKA